MSDGRSARRAALLTLSLLSGCAAAGPGQTDRDATIRRAVRETTPGDAGAYLSGRFAGEQGDLDRATDAFLLVLRHSPENAELRQQAFLAALLAGRPEARSLARSLIQSQPDNPLAELLVGSESVRAGQWSDAEARFAALPRTGMTQVLQPLLVAWAQQGSGRTDTALATLKPFAASDRFRPVYLLHSALIADLGERDPEAARLYAATEAEFSVPNLEVSRVLASWKARHGDRAGAEATLQRLAATSSELAIAMPGLRQHVADRVVASPAQGIAAACVALASALRAQDASDSAALLLRLALDLQPDLAGARLLSAEVDEQAHRPAAALDTLAGVAADDPLAPLAALRRVGLLEREGRTEEALGVLDRLAAAYPDRPEPWSLRGRLLRGLHRNDEAVAAYDRAVALTPNPSASDWPLFYERGIALERARRWPQAEADFTHALRLSPDQPNVLNYLGYSWTEQGRNLADARRMIERAVAQRPNDGAILDSLGWVLLRQGDVHGAVQNLERATELEPDDPTINGHLGDAYAAAGRAMEAGYQWRRALTLNPEPDEEERISGRLHDLHEAGEVRPVIGDGAPAVRGNPGQP